MRRVLLLAFLSAVSSWPTTPEFFPKYPNRYIQVLDGQWNFGFANKVDVNNVDPRKIETPETVLVPSVFDNAPPGVLGRRGTAFYRTTVDLDGPGLIQFTACSFYCKVWVDNVLIGEHRAGGYQPFWLNVPVGTAKTREIFVLADNRFNGSTAPTHTGGDFWQFGGIQRSVLVFAQPAETFLQRVEAFPRDLSGKVDINVVLGGKEASQITIQLSWDGSSPQIQTVEVTHGVGKLSVTVPNAKIWSITDPQLHLLEVSLLDKSKVVDVIQTRVGIRTVGINGARITLNGQAVKLHGYNRHTMWPDTGSAVSTDQINQDLQLLKSLGANYVRGAHYPQDQRFLDRCDELGIVVWEETLGPGVKVSNLLDPTWMKYQLQAVNEMIDASVNHPSVIMFAFYNEGPSRNESACPGYNASAAAIRARDSTRLVTWASNAATNDVCFEFADVLSFNAYPAWYSQAGDLTAPAREWNSNVQWAQAHWPSKPFTISETGAGGIYEWQNKTDVRWSQLYQAEVVEADVKVALNNSHVSGITLWQFADIKANDGDTATCGQCQYAPGTHDCTYIDVSCHRPGGENHKGSVDFWRRKKAAFTTVCKLFGGTCD
eukprot:TRINITY_DN8281_c0_g1_i1.p1 TRINITY_DN8281_c0_g1~~TRINITY_DN8281_c0_g1_i1.p1  ORF type:complete len:602 (+),score=62.71 TRINITY_DN8281_c0_g1_i1:40-1845(+)